ncbi:MAG: hypothetical protein E6G57_11520 [Actinobacteria bacterium]|nr:MAG: hypothetical protein E6G57_11520 [Actinomycetota bacterium]
MDWDAWARRAEKALDVAGRGDWRGLFAAGATIIEVDAEGRVTSWRDYLDRKEPENQIRQAVREQQQ